MLERLRSLFASKPAPKPASPSPAQMVPVWRQAAPLSPTTDFATLTNEGYVRNTVVYACVNEIAASLAQARVVVETKGDEPVPAPPDHPLVRLLERPNPAQPRYTFLESLMIFLNTTGNSFVHKARNAGGMPVELWNLRPDRMSILPGPTGPRGYEYDLGGTPQPMPAADVIHLVLPHPLDDFYGLSPIANAARSVDLDNKGLDYLRAFFLNGAAPAGILKLKEPADPEERERIRLLWREMYGSGRGWHELAVLDAAAEYQEIGSRPEGLGMEGVWGTTETRICAAFGVPPILIQVRTGIAKATYSNYREAVRAFWSETLVPMYARIGAYLTHGLASEFSGDLVIRFDVSNVDVLQDGAVASRAEAREAYKAGIITRNEARVACGLAPVEDGDDFADASRVAVDLPEPGAEDDLDEPDKDDEEPAKGGGDAGDDEDEPAAN
jgi:HK97 family phage portal protein